MSVDELARRVQADPEDRDARRALAAACARHQAWSALLLSPLASLTTWDETDHELQDLAIEDVGRRLEGAFRHTETRRWGCDVRRTGRAPERAEHRLATFEHLATGLAFQLLPGWRELEPFLIARLPVTRAAWCRGRGEAPPEDGERPVVQETFEACAEWCEGLGLRLPDDPEWAYAGYATVRGRYPWGDVAALQEVWHWGNSAAGPDAGDEAERRPQPPRVHDAVGLWNAFGLVDVIGNVYEWCSNRYAAGWAFDSVPAQIGRFPGRTTVIGSGASPHIGLRPAASIPGGTGGAG